MSRRLSIYKLIFVLVVVALLVSGATFAFWTWTSDINKNVVFTTADIEDYVIYDEGDSSFVGNFLPSDTYCESVNTTLSFYKKEEAIDIPLYATIKMDLNNVGENTSKSNDVYWVVTNGDSTVCEGLLDSDNVLAYGTFNGTTSGETLTLVDNIDIGLTEQKYTVWIWIDNAGTDLSNLSGEKIDVNVWTEITMKEQPSKLEFDNHTLMITSYSCKDENGNDVIIGTNPYFTYTGQCEVIDDGNGDWRIKFLTDGTFTSNLNIPIDAFLVGGGGGGGVSTKSSVGGGGGAGGYTTNTFAAVKKNTSYKIKIGDGVISNTNGESTEAFGAIAIGGTTSLYGSNGGNGGSGGGAGGYTSGAGGSGGSNGGNGGNSSGVGGSGQGKTTREFEEDTGTLYSTGGSGSKGTGTENGASANNNTGNGGGGSYAGIGGTGGSGIVVIRNYRESLETSELPNVSFDFTYTGNYITINDGNGNWRIKFLTSGTFTSNSNLLVDAFLVGGGGGGGKKDSSTYYGGGGGGGGYTITTIANIKKGISYEIVIGAGGGIETNGENTTAFGALAVGGSSGIGTLGGSGGSGGGGGGNGNGNGVPNTGGGGGGNSSGVTFSGKGGSGIIVIRNLR